MPIATTIMISSTSSIDTITALIMRIYSVSMIGIGSRCVRQRRAVVCCCDFSVATIDAHKRRRKRELLLALVANDAIFWLFFCNSHDFWVWRENVVYCFRQRLVHFLSLLLFLNMIFYIYIYSHRPGVVVVWVCDSFSWLGFVPSVLKRAPPSTFLWWRASSLVGVVLVSLRWWCSCGACVLAVFSGSGSDHRQRERDEDHTASCDGICFFWCVCGKVESYRCELVVVAKRARLLFFVTLASSS